MDQASSGIVSSDNCIVGVLDFLGYEQLVQNKEPEKIYRVLNWMLEQKDGNLDVSSDIRQALSLIRIQIISDTLVFVLDLSNWKQSTDSVSPVDVFFQLMSIFWIQLTMGTGFFLQGGITLGQYYQRDLNSPNNQFIFSKAVVDAHRLCKGAIGPLVMIDEHLWGRTELGNNKFKCQMLQNTRDEYYLDVYGFWKGSVDVHKQEIQGIRQAFNLQIKQNITNSKILSKYFEFMRYHNSRLGQMNDQKMFEQVDDFLLEIPGKDFVAEKY